jgi:ABC-type bacteriocin/lantibiotic exporter with double-glycine peptidase domain
LHKIIEQLGLKSFIEQLPQGLDTLVGEKGHKLSGGQRQLISMARALYRDSKVLLLDEPTASLDEANEKNVLNRIGRLSKDVTIIMISHKINNFENFDKVYRCERGCFSQQDKLNTSLVGTA